MFDYKTALNQLTQSNNGGQRAVVMIGAKNIVQSQEENFVAFKFMTGAANKANYIKITLNASDTYTVEFGYIRGMNYTVRSSLEGLYAEDLKSYFEEQTKLYLSL